MVVWYPHTVTVGPPLIEFFIGPDRNERIIPIMLFEEANVVRIYGGEFVTGVECTAVFRTWIRSDWGISTDTPPSGSW